MQKFFLILGSNLGPREALLRKAKEKLQSSWAELISESSIIETPAWLDEKQPAYLNQVLYMKTQLSAIALLRNILCLELAMGRRRNPQEPYAARSIDIDLLSYADLHIQSPILRLPHPQIAQRSYVKPLMLEAKNKAHA